MVFWCRIESCFQLMEVDVTCFSCYGFLAAKNWFNGPRNEVQKKHSHIKGGLANILRGSLFYLQPKGPRCVRHVWLRTCRPVLRHNLSKTDLLRSIVQGKFKEEHYPSQNRYAAATFGNERYPPVKIIILRRRRGPLSDSPYGGKQRLTFRLVCKPENEILKLTRHSRTKGPYNTNMSKCYDVPSSNELIHHMKSNTYQTQFSKKIRRIWRF